MATATLQSTQTDVIHIAREAEPLRDMTARVERLHSRLRDRMWRAQRIWDGSKSVLDDPEAAQLPLAVRKATGFRQVLLEMPIAIEEDELIVGNSLEDGVIVRAMMPTYLTEAEQAQAAAEGKSSGYGLAHKTPHYGDLLDKGLLGIIAEIEAKLADLEARCGDDERDAKIAMFQAMKLECQATIDFAGRFADLAEMQAAQVDSVGRAEELLRIAQVCRHVPARPARSFHEAIQSFWFVHYALFSTYVHLSCGRLDQYLYPSLQRDLQTGTITLEQAQELVDCLWCKANDRGQVNRANVMQIEDDQEAGLAGGNGHDAPGNGMDKPKRKVRGSGLHGMISDPGPYYWPMPGRRREMLATDFADAVNHWGQNILLSGIRPDGADGTNPLTYLCLNAHEKFAFTSPVVTVRLHKGSPPELVRRTAKVLKNDGSGMPYINNDDVIIKAYTGLGIPIEDARDYANSNCWETLLQGTSDQELVRGITFPLILEMALNRGVSQVHGQLGPDTGDPRAYASFDRLMDAWKVQMDHLVQTGVDEIGAKVRSGALDGSTEGKFRFQPLLSSLTRDCIARERDVTFCGARYTIWHVMAEGVANATDSLAAIKKLVYDEGVVPMDDLLTALAANWEGYEALRQTVVSRGPKFANDDPFADAIGREMMRYFVERSRFHGEKWAPEVIFACAVGTFSWYASIGNEVGATADGRRAHEPIAANLSPVPGFDRSGPIAAINTSLKMHDEDLAAGAPMDLRLSRSALMGEAGNQRLAGMLSGFVASGGNMLVLTITDVNELRRAMAKPQEYAGLRVRMGGWSAYFVSLSKEQQLLHISRVEHGLA